MALGSRTVGALNPGGESAASTEFQVPSGVAAGSFTVTVRADADGVVGETNETNNAASRTLGLGVDLVVSALKVPSVSGSGRARGHPSTSPRRPQTRGLRGARLHDRVLPHGHGAIDANAVKIGTQAIGKLAPGADSGVVTSALTIPQGQGAGSRIIVARANSGTPPVTETNTGNNTRARGTTIGRISRSPSSRRRRFTTGPGKTITVKDTTRNLGGGEVPASVTKFYFSTDATWSPRTSSSDSGPFPGWAGGFSIQRGAPDARWAAGAPSTIPANTRPGDYFLIIRANAGATAIEETNPDNNTRTATLAVSGGSDLVVASLAVALGEDAKLTISDKTKNKGAGPAASVVHAALRVGRRQLQRDPDSLREVGSALAGGR